MNLRRLVRDHSISLNLAVLTALGMFPSASLAQQHGGGHSGGHVGGVTHAASGNGFHTGQGSGNTHHGQNGNYSYGVGAWDGYGGYGGYGGWGGGMDAFGSMGMSPEDQEMVKQARYMDLLYRIRLQEMQAIQAERQANLANQQSQMLLNSRNAEARPAVTPLTNVGLGGLVVQNQIHWPNTTRTKNQALIAQLARVNTLLLMAHQQAQTEGFVDENLTNAAKGQLLVLKGAASKDTRMSKQGRQNFAGFVEVLEVTLDRLPRRPDPGTKENGDVSLDQAGRKLASNR